MTTKRLFSGELVEVRNPNEILQTLDSQGTLDGLPFMPEMAEYCGRRLRVSRRVEQTCVEVVGGAYDICEFIQSDVVFLESLRCSGAHHDNCQRACKFFWKEAWLRRVEGDPLGVSTNGEGKERLLARLITTRAPGHYYCQSTELAKATRKIPKGRRILKCFIMVFSGDVSPFKMVALTAVPLWRKMFERYRTQVLGTSNRTPAAALDLQPGEIVEVKSIEEIAQTLDQYGRNRGLQYNRLLGQYSGRRYRVRNRLDNMISEQTGEMKHPKATVILENLHCFCANNFGGCPRQDVIYWREIWLKRAADQLPVIEISGNDARGPK